VSSPHSPVLIPEWAEQSAILLAWPYAAGDFRPWLADVETTYARITLEVIRRENLIIACRNQAHRQHIENSLNSVGVFRQRIRYSCIPYNDVWVRDTAPLSIQTLHGCKFLDFRFNGWGGKYFHADDAMLAGNLYATGVIGTIPIASVDFVLEGGSVESDGLGTILTTTRCLLNPNRNPQYSREQIEHCLRTELGAARILWLEHGHAQGDDTDAHIDTLARFCSPDTIAYTACDCEDDPLYKEFQAMQKQLRSFHMISGQAYRLVPLPIPAPIYSEQGGRLPATYANFLILNEAVLVPIYNDPADGIALQRLSACFPDREIVAIDCVPLIRQYGSLHCMTMQFPAGVGVP